MRNIWWTWDLRMRWAHGFCRSPESFLENYRRCVDAAGRYGVDGIVVWGFLRDRHGGIETARAIVEYARDRGVAILPGFGVDDYGAAYCEGDSPYALNTYLRAHPEAQSRRADGSVHSNKWPPPFGNELLCACPSNEAILDFYGAALAWLVSTFALQGFQIEQGDSGVCHCDTCRQKQRVILNLSGMAARTSLDAAARRIPHIVNKALPQRRNMTIITETYCGLTQRELDAIRPFLAQYPEDFVISWQCYDWGNFRWDDGVRNPARHGCAALRTNNDASHGEWDDSRNIARAVALAKASGLDMTYIYGEYPDEWPKTRRNYEAWARAAAAS